MIAVMFNKYIPGLRAMLIRVVMRLGGWQPCPDPPYCKGHKSVKVLKELHSAPRDVKQLADLPDKDEIIE